jgi:hypothetical protein
MPLSLTREQIAKLEHKYDPHAPTLKPRAPAPAPPAAPTAPDPALTGALKLVIAAVKAGTASNEKLLAELLAALSKPKPALEAFNATVTARDAGGRIKDATFKVKHG